MYVRGVDGSLRRGMFRKKTHTNLYLNKGTHRYPAQKGSVLQALVHRTKRMVDNEHLLEEMNELGWIFHQNSYESEEICRVHRRVDMRRWEKKEVEKKKVVVIPFCSMIAACISQLLVRFNIHMVFRFPPPKWWDN